jgi:FkbM family methyltransferase
MSKEINELKRLVQLYEQDIVASLQVEAKEGTYSFAESLCRIIKQTYIDNCPNFAGFNHDTNFFKLAEKHGMHVLPVHYYSPIPSSDQIEKYAPKSYDTSSIELDFSSQINLLTALHPYFAELWPAPTEQLRELIQHAALTPFDLILYYSFIRAVKPNIIIEIGGGSSSIIARQAIIMNQKVAKLIVIEPYPSEALTNIVDTLVPYPVQQIDVTFFSQLQAGDILFIDSTHVGSLGSDVYHIIYNILPSLKPGVIVHFHDIMLPKTFAPEWAHQHQIFWNEQYLLHAFLMYNSDFQVVLSCNFDAVRKSDQITSLDWPNNILGGASGSLWMSRKESKSIVVTVDGATLSEHAQQVRQQIASRYTAIVNNCLLPDTSLGFPCLINLNGDLLWLPSDLLRYWWHTYQPNHTSIVPRFDAETGWYNWVKQHLNAGETAIDCGANIGMFSSVMARAVGSNGSVHAFEPDPTIASDLRRVLEVNNFTWTRVNQLALSDTTGTAAFKRVLETDVRRESSHLDVTGESTDELNTESILVNLTTLDLYVRENNLRPKLIKIDVEGAEMLVLKGATDVLTSFKPLLVIEIHNFIDDNHNQLKTLFRHYGYSYDYDGNKTYYAI